MASAFGFRADEKQAGDQDGERDAAGVAATIMIPGLLLLRAEPKA